ncbi:MAG: Amino acid/amide transporter rane protein 1, family [Rhizobacter sp.]|nr:Amino acid/amide transporter rane protein 1, family [Rhizobacter sp.]
MSSNTLELLLQLLANGVSTGVGYAMVALSLTLVFGVLHVINFAHGEVFMLGALTALVATRAGVPYLLALPAAVVAGVVIGILLDIVCVRPLLARGGDKTEVLLSTFAASLLVFEAVLILWGSEPADMKGVSGVVSIGSVVLPWQRVFILAAGIVVLLALEWVQRRTRFGVQMRAVAQSPFAASVVGIRLKRINSATFVLAAAIAALAGALLAPAIFFSPAMGHSIMIKAFVVVVMGGLGSARGAVLFGLLLGIFEALVGGFMSEGFAAVIIYALMLGTLLWRPNGLVGRAA